MADLEARGVYFEYEPRAFAITVEVPRIKCQACGSKITRVTRYTPDFQLGGADFWVEAKGKLTPNDRRRLEAFQAQHVTGKPGVRFRVIFMRDNWLTGTKRKRYSDWARETGIVCAVGDRIPEEWTKWIPATHV